MATLGFSSSHQIHSPIDIWEKLSLAPMKWTRYCQVQQVLLESCWHIIEIQRTTAEVVPISLSQLLWPVSSLSVYCGNGKYATGLLHKQNKQADSKLKIREIRNTKLSSVITGQDTSFQWGLKSAVCPHLLRENKIKQTEYKWFK